MNWHAECLTVKAVILSSTPCSRPRLGCAALPFPQAATRHPSRCRWARCVTIQAGARRSKRQILSKRQLLLKRQLLSIKQQLRGIKPRLFSKRQFLIKQQPVIKRQLLSFKRQLFSKRQLLSRRQLLSIKRQLLIKPQLLSTRFTKRPLSSIPARGWGPPFPSRPAGRQLGPARTELAARAEPTPTRSRRRRRRAGFGGGGGAGCLRSGAPSHVAGAPTRLYSRGGQEIGDSDRADSGGFGR